MYKFLLFPIFLFVFSVNAQIVESKIYSLFLQQQYEQAIASIDEIEILHHEDFYYAGLSAESIEDNQLAAALFKKSIALDSTYFPAQVGLAKALYQNEECINAIEIFSKLLEIDTLNAFLWSSLGDCYYKIGLHPLAYRCYRNAFYLKPKNGSNTLKLITALGYMKTKRDGIEADTLCEHRSYTEEALFYCDSSLVYNPTNKPLLRRKGFILFANKNFISAEQIFDLLLSLRDSSFQVLKHAGICKAQFLQHDEAIPLLRKAYLLQNNDLEVMLHFASSLSVTPQYFDEAKEIISAIFKSQQPDSAVIYQAHTLLAQSYAGINDIENAVVEYFRSIKKEDKTNKLLRMANLSNRIVPETKQTLLWFVHYYFLQNFKPEFEKNWDHNLQKKYSQTLLTEYLKYMHVLGIKKAIWQTFEGKKITVTMDDLQKILK